MPKPPDSGRVNTVTPTAVGSSWVVWSQAFSASRSLRFGAVAAGLSRRGPPLRYKVEASIDLAAQGTTLGGLAVWK